MPKITDVYEYAEGGYDIVTLDNGEKWTVPHGTHAVGEDYDPTTAPDSGEVEDLGAGG